MERPKELEITDSVSESIESDNKNLDSFPIVEFENEYFAGYNTEPEAIDGKIIKYLVGTLRTSSYKYLLGREIGGYKYLFKLYQQMGIPTSNIWTLAFKTHDYGYAVAKLDDTARAEVFQTLSGFLDSIQNDLNGSIEYVEVSPADTKYSSEELEACVQEILKLKGNVSNREQLLQDNPGARLFELYEKLAGKKFYTPKNPRRSGGREARHRLFQSMFKKYLKHWEIEEEMSRSDIYLKPKE